MDGSAVSGPFPGRVLYGEGQPDGEDGVGPARLAVHVRRSDRPRLVALHNEIVNLLGRDDKQLREPLHIGPQDVVLAHAQTAAGSTGGGDRR